MWTWLTHGHGKHFWATHLIYRMMEVEIYIYIIWMLNIACTYEFIYYYIYIPNILKIYGQPNRLERDWLGQMLDYFSVKILLRREQFLVDVMRVNAHPHPWCCYRHSQAIFFFKLSNLGQGILDYILKFT